MKNQLTPQQVEDILKILDDLVAHGGWNSTTFLRVIAKKLQAIRDDFAAKAALHHKQKTNVTSNLANRVAIRSGQQEIFIALYTADGGNIQAWERMIINLPKQIISRPIYANEEDVNQAIRGKENKINEAYVSIYINQTDILPMGDKTPMDKFGKALLTLKDRAIQLENINRFVHVSGVYGYEAGRLIKETQPDQ